MTRSARRQLGRITGHWERLGTEDPLWAVYVAPGTRGRAWNVDEFFATGRAEIERVMGFAEAHGVPACRETALDFGCGVGRLSQPLAQHFDRVIGVDVSAAMLTQARATDGGPGRIEFVLNHRADLSFISDASVDLVYSSLVLQHLSRALAARYLAEFVRVLADDGAAVVQVATRPTRSVKGWAFRALPPPLIGLLQRRLLGYPAPMRMQAMSDRWIRAQLSSVGASVMASETDSSYRGHWVYTRYLIQRGPAEQEREPRIWRCGLGVTKCAR